MKTKTKMMPSIKLADEDNLTMALTNSALTTSGSDDEDEERKLCFDSAHIPTCCERIAALLNPVLTAIFDNMLDLKLARGYSFHTSTVNFLSLID